MPYLIKVSSSSDTKSALKPSPYHLAQLGVMAAAYGKDKGLLFIVYPKLNDLIQVYEISYKDIHGLLRYVQEIIGKLEKSIKNKDFSDLPPNPRFINSDFQTQIGN